MGARPRVTLSSPSSISVTVAHCTYDQPSQQPKEEPPQEECCDNARQEKNRREKKSRKLRRIFPLLPRPNWDGTFGRFVSAPSLPE